MSRPILTAVNHFCIFPFNFGGALAIRGLYKGLSEWFDINIITFSVADCYPKELYLNKHIKVITIVVPPTLVALEKEMYKKYGMSSTTMVDPSLAVLKLYHQIPEIVDEVRNITQDSLVVLAEHVFTWNLIKEACREKHLWYRSLNVEYDYKIDTWGAISCPDDLLQEVYNAERDCCLHAEKVLAISNIEKERFMELYELPANISEKIMDIHAGYDVDDLETVLPSKRSKISDEYTYTGLFIATDAPHTRQAAEHCFTIARRCPHIKIYIMGSVCKAYLGSKLPQNVALTGVVTDDEKKRYLKSCDFALNIMEDGAGVNVKMFEYFAYGIPVIASAYGARGIEVTDGKDVILTDIEGMVETVNKFCALPAEDKDVIAKNALKLINDRYSWRNLSYNVAKEIERLYNISVFQNKVPLEEVELYEMTDEDVYCPSKPFYIRCAGIRGRNCYSMMIHRGLSPLGFVDENKCYTGTGVNGIPVISVDEYIKNMDGTEIIVANTDVVDITVDLINRGVDTENISISMANGYVTRLLDDKVKCNSYYDSSKTKRKILSLVSNKKL